MLLFFLLRKTSNQSTNPLHLHTYEYVVVVMGQGYMTLYLYDLHDSMTYSTSTHCVPNVGFVLCTKTHKDN
jgi:hypothetical protein